jgi:ABC-2 type transport system ATP-binding protein
MSELPSYAVEIENLSKTYRPKSGGEVHALDNVSLNIPRGSFFALLGPNGAGKSTLINIMAGLVLKSAGRVSIWGRNIDERPRQARAAIGIVPQELNIDPFFTPRALLDIQAGLYGVPKRERRTDEILEAIGLKDKATAYARSLSGGMRRRLLVGKAMVHSPPVLVLDEPTAGVDIELRRQLWDYVRELNRAGVTVLLTTHYLEEAEELCDTIAIINHGKLIACEATGDLLRRMDSKELRVQIAGELDRVPDALTRFEPELEDGNRLVFRFAPSRVKVAEILDALSQAKLGIADLTTEEADLEDIFLSLTRRTDGGDRAA